MNTELILNFGRYCQTIIHEPESEYRDSFVRAFKEKRADYIIIDSNMNGNRFRAASIAWAVEQGLLYCDRESDGDQETVWSFRLTEKGRKEILGE